MNTSQRKIRAILFDLDGVLIDATEWHYEALNRALSLFGYEISRYEHVAMYNGLPTRKKLEMLSIEKGLPDALHGLISQVKQVHTREEILRNCKPSFEKEYMLARLSREGYRLGVCSNAIRESVELMLRQAGLHPFFEFMISNEDVERPKPNPEIYLKAIDRLGIPADEVVIVEDAPHGVEAAQKTGGHLCVVKGFEDVDYFRLESFIQSIESGNHRK